MTAYADDDPLETQERWNGRTRQLGNNLVRVASMWIEDSPDVPTMAETERRMLAAGYTAEQVASARAPKPEPAPAPAPTPAKISTLCTIPEGGMPLATVEICEYLDAKGQHAWALRSEGDTTYSTTLGLMELARLSVGADYIKEHLA